MKQRYPLLVFLTLIISAIAVGLDSYESTERNIRQDMDQALAQTLKEERGDVITTDTIRTFNRHLQMEGLRGRAQLSLRCPVDNKDKVAPTLEAYCPTTTVLQMSDQRPTIALASLAFVWAFGCGLRRRSATKDDSTALRTAGHTSFPFIYSSTDDRFFTADGQEVRFTPMQHQLMVLFLLSPDCRLTKTDICDALWPKKEDASETLYTLIRRIKPTIEAHSRFTVESDRGRAYYLKDRHLA